MQITWSPFCSIALSGKQDDHLISRGMGGHFSLSLLQILGHYCDFLKVQACLCTLMACSFLTLGDRLDEEQAVLLKSNQTL